MNQPLEDINGTPPISIPSYKSCHHSENNNDGGRNNDRKTRLPHMSVEIADNNDSEIIFEEHQNDKNTTTVKTNKTMQTIASLAGNILEWYDFSVFGCFSDVIGDVFFPPQKGHAAIVESFAVFGGAFLMRPLGGVLMGHIGDKYGRKLALESSIFLMAIPTFLMGCLPTYQQIGWPAIIFLLIVRLLQGLSVGGQMMSSLVFTVENTAPKHRWGLYGSFVMASSSFGTLLGSVVGYLMRVAMPYESLRDGGWRYPFLCGLLVSVSGAYLKYYGEDEGFVSAGGGGGSRRDSANPLEMALRSGNRRSLLASCLVPIVWSSGYYLIFIWMAIFMNDLVQPPLPQAFAINALSLFVSQILFFPLAGHLSDIYGRIRIMAIGGTLLLLYGPIAIYLVQLSHVFLALVAQTTLGMALSLWGGPMLAWLVEGFEPAARLTSVSIGYNVAMALGASVGPSLATVMVDKWGVTSPGYLFSFFAMTSLIGLWIAPLYEDVHSESVQRNVSGPRLDENKLLLTNDNLGVTR